MRVVEIFKSINGEVSSQHQGSLCLFIRLSGCNLRCSYCDTPQAQDKESGRVIPRQKILDMIHEAGCKNIVFTGGEPLLQWKKSLGALILELSDHRVSVETNGSMFIPRDDFVSFVVDWKLTSSGMNGDMHRKNFHNLSRRDFIKFVIHDRDDFEEAVMATNKIFDGMLSYYRPKIVFSPINREMSAEIIEWMKADPFLCEIGAIFSLQIHKVIGVP